MRIAVIGSRGFTDQQKLYNILEQRKKNVSKIVSGGARGADTMAAQWANKNGIELVEYLPEYDKYGRGAPLKRNHLIVNDSDIVLAFWDGRSRGTKYTIDLAKKTGIPVEIFT